MKILIVEDNLLNQKIVMFNLKKQNYLVDAAINGNEALEKIEKEKYDLILMDIMLPEKNGYEITAEIRKKEKIKGIKKPVPIIAITANTLDNDRERCLKAGMNDYLAKPFSTQELFNVIKKYIGIVNL